MYRAAIVAAVGAWEAFIEDLAAAGLAADPSRKPPVGGWLNISSSVQTPNADNVRRLLWTLFDYDPETAWTFTVVTSGVELGGTNGWRVARHTHTGADASKFLNLMLSVRHGFAHQDPAATATINAKGNRTHIKALPGMAYELAGGGISIQKHHATNAISVILQLAILSAHQLANTLGLGVSFRWMKSMTEADWEWWLDGPIRGDAKVLDSPALTLVKANWIGPLKPT